MDKIALVTKVLDFAGPAAVEALLEEGYTVVAQDLAFHEDAQRESYQSAHSGAVPLSTEEPEALIREVWERYGRLDVLLSNDTWPAVHVPIEEAEVEDLRKTIEQVMIYPYRLLQAAIPRLKEQGRGNVILVTSCRTELPQPGGAIPDMARAGANALVKSLSIELAPFGIPVNAVAPNYLYSEAYFPNARYRDDPRGQEFIRQEVPAGRLGEPRELGELILYLANMQGAFHTGTVIKFAGGWPAARPRPF